MACLPLKSAEWAGGVTQVGTTWGYFHQTLGLKARPESIKWVLPACTTFTVYQWLLQPAWWHWATVTDC
jgi:hypothetical protein